MGPELIGLSGVVLLFILIAGGIHIAVAAGITGIAGMMIVSSIDSTLNLLGWLPYSDLASFSWVTVPLFLIMGDFALCSGISENAFFSCSKWLGNIKGGLAMAVTAACALFGACSGSSLATTATMVQVAAPELKKYQFDEAFSIGVIAASGTLASLIPPSIALIVYSMLTQTSLIRLLLAGFIPGFVSAVLYMLMIYFWVRLNPKLAPKKQSSSWDEKLKSIPGVGGIAVVIVFIIGGMYAGVFTASEAAATGSILTLIMALLKRRLTIRVMKDALAMATVTTSSIFFIVLGALIFSKFLALSGLTRFASEMVSNLNAPPLIILIGIILLYIFLGMFLEYFSMLAVSLPFVYPVIISIGYDPIWFGVIVVKMIEVAVITPPVGLSVYTASGITRGRVPVEAIFKNVMPFLCIDLTTVAVLIAFPQLVLWLPSHIL